MDGPRAADVGFRAAIVADCTAVAGVHVRSWRESFAGIVPQAFLDRLTVEHRTKSFERGFSAPFYRMYVAESADRGIVGFADFGEPRRRVGAYDGELYSIYLLPEFQRQGIGARLFRLGVEFLAGSGRSSMYLQTLEVSPYRSFYEKLGGRIVSRERTAIEGIEYEALIYGWDRLH